MVYVWNQYCAFNAADISSFSVVFFFFFLCCSSNGDVQLQLLVCWEMLSSNKRIETIS